LERAHYGFGKKAIQVIFDRKIEKKKKLPGRKLKPGTGAGCS